MAAVTVERICPSCGQWDQAKGEELGGSCWGFSSTSTDPTEMLRAMSEHWDRSDPDIQKIVAQIETAAISPRKVAAV